jgi:5'-nucleotidase
MAEPTAVGGAARFATLVERLRAESAAAQIPTLLLFSGDVLSPSNLSVITKGNHMIPIFNYLKVDVGCLGNHDLDFGEGVLAKWISKQHTCTWLITNILSAASKTPLATCKETVIAKCGNVRVGIMGLMDEGSLMLAV